MRTQLDVARELLKIQEQIRAKEGEIAQVAVETARQVGTVPVGQAIETGQRRVRRIQREIDALQARIRDPRAFAVTVLR